MCKLITDAGRSRLFPGILALAFGAMTLHCAQTSDERRSEIYDLRADPVEQNLLEIRKALIDTDRDVRATALNALVGLQVDDAADLVIAGLADEDGFVRASAAKLAADLQEPRAVETLVRMLTEDSDPVARLRTAEALTRLGGEQAKRGLAVGLEDPMQEVRLAAITGIRKLDPAYAVDTLSRMLIGDEVWEIRVQAARALGALKQARLRPVLEQALQDSNEFVRAAAANALKHDQTVGERPTHD